MTRKLLILAAIAALFTIMTAVPALSIAVNTGDGAKTVLDNGLPEASNPAHGPICGFDGAPITCANGATNSQGAPADGPLPHPVSTLTFNAGAWNAVFGPGGISNLNSAICGIKVVPGTEDPDNTCVQP
jgi:hypothetical protein